ncbi:putative LuxR family transcriptional regulator [Liberibacter crescens BT-1]|uniref:Putative LuxR family transcriptional regulator n=1 Tax=Liberibacter crescens (strain BT-1) TaxID=1215343 RepID=L0EU40_LIBCB|nr:helix-turn-helix transcriptional regulator [Liberibacter crescens]AGA64173.1 putative LuxR family transcriptional regulator [Liberibacter crescens BT-1]AMC12436.1 LuxR family transcriptional regulator [Liberibacter crescens]
MTQQQSTESKVPTSDTSTGKRLSSQLDVFSRLTLLQKKIRASNFILYTIQYVHNVPRRQRLIRELGNYDSSKENIPDILVEAYGDQLLLHFDRELLPITWSKIKETKFSKLPEHFSMNLEGGILPVSGIAFPVRLGFLSGNGYIVFTADHIKLSNEVIIEAHGECFQMMIDFLEFSKRRTMSNRNLTDREIACLQLAGDGYISEEIADKLDLSIHTVNVYLGSATVKLDAVNRVQAIAKAMKLGYIY